MARGQQKIQSQQRKCDLLCWHYLSAFAEHVVCIDCSLEKQKSAAHSQLKVNENAKSIMCQICRQTFLCTTKVRSVRVYMPHMQYRLRCVQ